LQGANDLLELLADDTIWSQLLRSGFQSDGRRLLASALDAARRGYQAHRQQLERSDAPSAARDAAGAAVLDTSRQADVTLERIVGTVCSAGQRLFVNTASLSRRFGSAAAA
jgi:hypothetical protein